MSEPSSEPEVASPALAATSRHWQRVGVTRRSGVCVPVSALRTDRDCGVGDFADLRAMVDWCRAIGANVLQILPVNDMGKYGSIPYAALSAFALDPLYIALDEVEEVRADWRAQSAYFEARSRLNPAPRVDFDRVRKEKEELLLGAFRRQRNAELDRKLLGFRQWNPWLDAYARYRTIKELNDYRSWEEWGPRYASDDARQRLDQEHEERLSFHVYEQWLAAEQLRAARRYADAQGVLLKGDIPILVARDSADVWSSTRFFRLDTAAGAPPDMYSEDGQNWGFPTYDWDALAAEDYSWWRHRLRHAQQFFDLYRIDHVVGFFRIWTIPYGRKGGKEGAFVPADQKPWGEHGRKLLSMMLESCDMLPLAEDLGTVPDVCRRTLREMGICGLKVQRWERWWEKDRTFVWPEQYPELSVATLSTHDSETLAGWWQAFPADRQELWTALGRTGPAPDRIPPEFHLDLIRWLAGSRSRFLILMLQDLLEPFGLLPRDPADHRINVPGTLVPENWTWRCPVSLGVLLGEADRNRTLRAVLAR